MKELIRFIIKMTIITMASLFAAQAFSQTQVYIDPKVECYVYEYIEELNKRGVDIPAQQQFMVGFSNISKFNAAGMALGMFHSSIVLVTLDKDILNLDHNQIRWVVFHELSHDIFDLRHDSGLSLMKRSIPLYVSSNDVKKALDEVSANVLFLKKPKKQDSRWQERRSLKEQLTAQGTGEASEQVKGVFRLSTSRILRNY